MINKIKGFIVNDLYPFILSFLKSKKFHTFLWQTANGFIAILAAALADVDWKCVPLVFAGLNWLTKYINKKYLS